MITASEFLKWVYVFGIHTGGGGGGTVTSITAGSGLTGGTITTSGTIALDIPVTSVHGGTGLTSFAAHSMLYASAASTWAELPSANNAILGTNGSGVPSFSTTLPSGLTIPGYLPLSGGTMSGALVLAGAPLTDTEAATKLYVDQTVVSLTPTQPVQAASTGNFASTYNNGSSGVGATLTATSTGTVTLDGVLTVLGKDYLFKDQTDNTQNGAYTCTTEGAIGVAAVFTRATWFNTPAAITAAGLTPVINGSTQAGEAWYEVNDVTTIGTDPIVFVRFGNSGTVTSITAGTGLTGGTITGSGTIALATPVAVTNGGTGLSSTTANAILFSSATSVIGQITPAANSVLVTGAGNIPVLSTTLPSGLTIPGYQASSAALSSIAGLTTVANNMIYTTAANTYAVITPANNSVMVTSAGGVPSLSTTLPSGLTIPGYALSGANGDITSMTGLTGALRAPTAILDANGNNVVTFGTAASAVNYATITNAATGNPVLIDATGADSSVPLNFRSKGNIFNFSSNNATGLASIRLFSSDGNHYVGLATPLTTTATQIWTLPAADIGGGGLLQSNGSSVWSMTNTPALGTPASGVLTNTTGYTVANLADVAWTDFSGTIGFTGFSANPSVTVARYKIIGKTLFYNIGMNAGTSNATTFTITGMPVAAARVEESPLLNGVNNSTSVFTVTARTSASSTTLTMVVGNNASGWTASGTKAVNFSGFYETT